MWYSRTNQNVSKLGRSADRMAILPKQQVGKETSIMQL